MEREFVHRMLDAGFVCRKQPLSGAIEGHKGDIVLHDRFMLECKARKEGFKTLYKWIEKDQADGLILKANNEPFLVVLTMNAFIELNEGYAAWEEQP